MRIFTVLSLLVLIIATPFAVEAGRRGGSRAAAGVTASEQDVLQDLGQTLDLWREGNYDQVYERSSGGDESKEGFGRKLSSAPRRPSCCWEKIQEQTVTFKGDRSAVVKAKFGFESSVPGTDYVTREVHMKKEGGSWIASRSEILSLSGYTGRKRHYKYLPIQQK